MFSKTIMIHFNVHTQANNHRVALSDKTVIWKDLHKKSADVSVSDSFSITAYTAFTLPHNECKNFLFLYYASENINGQQCYDYMMINF